MMRRISLILIYLLLWICFFEIARILFLMYNWNHSRSLDLELVAGTLIHGWKLDSSAASMITLIPAYAIARVGFLPERIVRRFLVAYTGTLLLLASIVVVSDLEIFRMWGYHLEADALRYLANPREATASATGSPLGLLLGMLVFLFTASIAGFWALLFRRLAGIPSIGLSRSILLVGLALPCLGIGALGGLRWRVPLSAGSVYFSSVDFANQAAINATWNFFVSASNADRDDIHHFLDQDGVRMIVDSLLGRAGRDTSRRSLPLLRVRPKRIVLILWEGFTAKIAAPMGGIPGVTPGFTHLTREGILFDSIFAAGPRTTNGLLAVLAGLPSHPLVDPLTSTERIRSLPSLSKSLSKAGYRTDFYYGATLEFDNRNRYIGDSTFDVIVEKKHIDRRFWNSAWGPHDTYILDRLFRAVDSTTRPIFAVTLTLSSHEPFEVPTPAVIPGSSGESKFLNAQRYTDRSVSAFIQRLKGAQGWDSTLVILIADHGSVYPTAGSSAGSSPEHYRIPMLWLGGAIAIRDTVISQIGSQLDLATTLLAQVGARPDVDFRWGRDLADPSLPAFAFYSFRDGFGFVEPGGTVVFDNISKSVVHSVGMPRPGAVIAGRAYQQAVMQHYRALSRPAGR